MAHTSINIVPATYQQEGIWYHALTHDTSFWNVVDFKSYQGIVDTPALREALKRVVERHSALRTNFVQRDSGLFQIINDHVSIENIFDEYVFDPEYDTDIQLIVDNEIAWGEYHNFDFEKDPLMKLKVLQFNDRVFMILTISHIIHDIASLNVIWRELMSFYNSKTREDFASSQPAQYFDYALRQREFLGSDEYLNRKQNELKKFPEGSFALEPVFYSSRNESRMCRNEVELPKQLVHDLRSLALKKRVIFSAVFQLAYFIFLYRYFDNDTLLIANIASGREKSEKESALSVGLFANRIGNSVRIDPERSIGDQLVEMNASVVESLKNNIPIEDLLRDKQFRDKHGIIQIQSGFNVVSAAATETGYNGLQAVDFTVHRSRNEEEQYDTYLYLVNRGETVNVRLELRCDQNLQQMAPLAMDQYLEILRACVYTSHLRVSEISSLTKTEQSLLDESNRTKVLFASDVTMIDFFERQSVLHPDNVALVFNDERLTYRELNERSNRLAHYLNQFETNGEFIGICLDRSPWMVVSLLAVQKCGRAYVPIDPGYPSEWIAHVSADAGIELLITSNNAAPADIPSVCAKVLVDQDQAVIEKEPCNNLSRSSNDESLAYAIYTSGSTGKPKGVMIEHGALTNFLLSMKRLLSPVERFSLLSVTTFSFDIFYLELYLPLILGGSVILAGQEATKDGRKLHRLIAKHRPDFMQATPSGWQMILDSAEDKLEGLTVLCGGEAMPDALKTSLFARKAKKVWNLFGPTETTIWSTAEELKPEQDISIGKPIANTQIFILDSNKRPAPVGKKGNLYIGGAGLAKGYLNRDDLTAQRFIENPFLPGQRLYFTGDIARWLPDGRIEFFGRSDNQVKIRGHRIELGAIEEALSRLEQVRVCSVVAHSNTQEVKTLVAYVVPNGTFDEVTLSQKLKEALPEYMVPTLWVQMDNMPLTPNGKLDRKRLPVPGSVSNNYLPARNETEKAIAEIWSDLLGIRQVGINDDFFLLGGHSLVATRVVSAIQKKFDITIPMKALFDFKRLGEFASYVDLVNDRAQNQEFEVIDIGTL